MEIASKGRPAHAYLFVGYDDAGGASVAFTVAKALNCCRDAPHEAPCGTCPACRKIESGNHPDVKFVRPDGNFLKINQIREIKRGTSYKPYEGRWKIWIIEDSDKMTEEAANSLLKVLEEPPGDTVIILLSSNPSALLPTVVSRCQIVHLAGESSRVEDVTLRGEVFGFLKEALSSQPSRVLEIALSLERRKDSIENVLNSIALMFRDMLVMNATRDRALLADGGDLLLADGGSLGELLRTISEWSIRELVRSIEVVEEARAAIRRNANLRLALEVMLFRLKGVHRNA